MASASAAPAELRKESKRAVPKMQAAYDDPSHHSQHRVLADFGRSFGVDPDSAADLDDLDARMQEITRAWNALPQEERLRRMPDPSPKGTKGAELTEQVNRTARGAGPRPPSPVEVAEAAADARAARFVRDCFRLVEWVGESCPVTKAGLLRPATARQAYQHLDLWPWERGLEEVRWEAYRVDELKDPEVDAVRARVALESWRSAGDCFPLDRLWYAIEGATFIEIGPTRARPNLAMPTSDEEWSRAGMMLVLGLAMRVGEQLAGPLALTLARAAAGETSQSVMRRSFVADLPPSVADVLAEHQHRRFDEMLYVFGDTGLWRIDGDDLTLTALGELFIDPFWNAIRDGLIEVE